MEVSGSGAGGGPRMRWWGWGHEDRRVALTPSLARALDESLGLDALMSEPVALSAVAVPKATLTTRARQRLEAVVGREWVNTDATSRILHSGGKSYLDLVAMRAGAPRGAPDAVVYPDSHEAVLAVLAVCASERVAVVPFGGGTSVVGGLAPIAGSQHAVISLDMSRLAGVFSVDRRSQIVSVAAGTPAPALEAALAELELTLGHYPDSFEFVSIGGCAATRSVGQASSGYGRIDEAIHGVRFASPAGECSLAALPASAAGPALRELIVGSEGVLGVITGLLLRVRARPAHRIYEGVLFDSFDAAADAVRVAVQDEATPDVVRISDEVATRLWLAAGEERDRGLPRGRLGRRARAAVLAVVGWEGQRLSVQRRRLHTMTLLRRGGGVAVGEGVGRAWARSRFAGPYLRDELLARGVLVDQFETATTWTGLAPLRAAVTAALTGALSSLGTPPLIGCQISHVYETGASLTFTVLARALEDQESAQWRAAKDAAGTAIVGSGATISHHHGIGRDNASWAATELGPVGTASLRALKAQFDPLGVMNPGKLILAA